MAARRLLLAALLAPGGREVAVAEPTIAGPLVPRRVHLPSSLEPWSEALQALRRDGAVVLSGLTPAVGSATAGLRAIAGELPGLLFSGDEGASVPSLLSPGAPVNGVHEELLEAKKRGLYLPGSGLLPHTDGYVYGDDMPDYVFLVCEQQASRGGGNVLLDGQALVGSLETGDAEQQQLAAWLSAVPVDLSEPSETGITAGRPAEGPVLQRHAAASGVSRLKWRRQINVREAQRTSNWHPLSSAGATGLEDSEADVGSMGGGGAGDAGDRQAASGGGRYLSLWRPLASADEEAAAEAKARLRELDELLQRSTAAAFANHSFMLEEGEALVVDNYRVLHGRAPYAPMEEGGAGSGEEPERRFWRVWAWTSDGSGPPPDGVRTSHPLNDEVFGEKPDAGSRAAEL